MQNAFLLPRILFFNLQDKETFGQSSHLKKYKVAISWNRMHVIKSFDCNGLSVIGACSCQEEQLDAILSTAVETSSLGLITGCIKQWTAEGERF